MIVLTVALYALFTAFAIASVRDGRRSRRTAAAHVARMGVIAVSRDVRSEAAAALFARINAAR